MKFVLIVSVLLCCYKALNAQQTVSASGGNITGSEGSLSYTLGQISYVNLEDHTSKITQGVQQPYEIMIVTGISKTMPCDLQFRVYPNPTNESVILIIEKCDLENLCIKLYSIDAKQLQTIKVTDHETMIPLTNFPSGIYLAEIVDSHNVISSFKIIKTIR